jgi:hypothetical protein
LTVDEWVLVLDLAAVTSVSLYEHIDEVLDGRLWNTILHDAESPRVKRLIVGQEELLSAKVPTTGSTRSSLRTSILDFRWWKEASIGLEHVRDTITI